MPSKSLKGASAPVLTVPAVFHYSVITHEPLLQVRDGLPAREALQAASLVLAAAVGVAKHFADNQPGDPDAMFAPLYLVEMGKALLDSVELPDVVAEGGAA